MQNAVADAKPPPAAGAARNRLKKIDERTNGDAARERGRGARRPLVGSAKRQLRSTHTHTTLIRPPALARARSGTQALDRSRWRPDGWRQDGAHGRSTDWAPSQPNAAPPLARASRARSAGEHECIRAAIANVVATIICGRIPYKRFDVCFPSVRGSRALAGCMCYDLPTQPRLHPRKKNMPAPSLHHVRSESGLHRPRTNKNDGGLLAC